jgi:thiamine biosynthesis lipoprotein
VTSLNQALRAERPAVVTPSLRAMIRMSAQLEDESYGLFNAGLGGAVGAWGFHDDVMRPGPRPSLAELARWRNARPSLAQLEIRGHEVRSRNPLLQLDFGAVAKGFAIDWSLGLLRGHGIDDALVNLGGNLAAMGQGGMAPWRIGIRDPWSSAGLIARLHTRGREAVVTSGSYERFRVLDGERFTHILDPLTSAPASELVSVTVVHGCAARADAAATALLVAGPQRWRRVAQRMRVHEVLVVDRDGHGEATAALARRLQFAAPHWRDAITTV